MDSDGYTPAMSSLENKLKTIKFWLWLGVLNHRLILFVIALGCAYSGFTCQGESMKEVLSIYAFTLFTPQIALEVIVLIALLFVSDTLREFRENGWLIMLFMGTLSLLVLFIGSS